MPQSNFVEVDPVTKRPIQQPVQILRQPQTQPQQVVNQQQPGQFDVEKFAADSATRQMLWAYQRGFRPTQQDFESARQAAYSQGMETMRAMALETSRAQTELQKQMQMRTFTEFGPRNMSAEEIKDASGLLNAHSQIMQLYHQNLDIGENDPYRTTVGGDVAAKVGTMMDPNIRLYEATRGGSIITLGRGLLQDTGQVAGKEEAQTLIKQLMPGPGDSGSMAARKTADMIQMEMNGLQAKIQALPQNVDSTPLKSAYANAYNDYAQLVNQFGSNAQKNFAPRSPEQLFGQVPGQPAGSASPVIKPAAVQAGLSQGTSDSLTAQAGGRQPLGNQPGFTEADPVTKQPLGGTVWRPPTGVPPLATPSPAVYPSTAEYPGGEQPGLAIERLKGLLPKQGGPTDPSLVMPPGSQGPVTWGQ